MCVMSPFFIWWFGLGESTAHEYQHPSRRGATENERGLHRYLRLWPLSKNYGKAEEDACRFALYDGLEFGHLWAYLLDKYMKGGTIRC